MSKAKEYFEKNGYVILQDALTKQQCKELTEHMFKLFDEGKLVKDEQCPLSDAVYGDSVFDGLLEVLAKPIGEQVGRKLLPTYTYARIYRNGEVLKKHKDRPACEISATLTLGYDAKNVWRIYFDEEKEIGVDLDVGEMAVYKGCEILHWRPAFKGNWHVQVFFHYVDADGPYAQHALDGRSNLGVHKDKNVSTPEVKQQPLEYKFAKPLFNVIGIPSIDNEYPGYYCIDRNNMPQFMFTKEECNKIVGMLNEAYPLSASVGGTKDASRVARSIRSAAIYALDNDTENRWIYEKIANIVSFVNATHFDYEIMGITHALQLIEYESASDIKGHYDWHVDVGTGDPTTRKISLVVQLTEPTNYQDCELIINNHGNEIVATKEQGSVHLFPSYMTHTVTPISKGVRHSLVIWIHGSRRFR
jgi:predicted 2-oxoglutarate/Fe(II)-dependent dioxygenase YbiX